MRLNMGIGFIINLLCPDLLFRNRVNNARRIISAIFPNLIAFMEILFCAYHDYNITRPVYSFLYYFCIVSPLKQIYMPFKERNLFVVYNYLADH